MLTDIEKKYWKKVYLYFGNDYRAWVMDTELFEDEWRNTMGLGVTNFNENGYLTKDEKFFTQKFIDEILEE